MLVLGGVAADRADGRAAGARARSRRGAGLERFRRIIEHQGGDPRVVDDYGRLPAAPDRHVVKAPRAGYLTRLDAELVGRASVALGAGRDRVEDPVDPAVGIMVLRQAGRRGVAPAIRCSSSTTATARAGSTPPLALARRGRSSIGDDAAAPPRPLIVGEVH